MTDAAPTRFSPPLIVLHWLMALMILGLYAAGLSVDLFAKPERPFVVNLHAVVGLALILLLVFRVILKIRQGSPAYPGSMGPMFQKAAKAGHGLLYLLMAIVPFIGLRAFLFRGRAFDFGLFQIPTPFDADKDIAHQAHEIHGLAAHLLIALVVGHILVALYHQFVLRDNLLARMKIR